MFLLVCALGCTARTMDGPSGTLINPLCLLCGCTCLCRRHHKLRARSPTEPLKPAAVILDFRHCVKQIIYGSIEAGYYAGVLPIRFLLVRDLSCACPCYLDSLWRCNNLCGDSRFAWCARMGCAASFSSEARIATHRHPPRSLTDWPHLPF